MDNIFFYLPDFYDKYDINMLTCDLIDKFPEYFYDNIKIGGVYGTFPNSIWNGGRVVLGGVTKEEIDYIISEFNKRNVAVRYTFTNPMLEEKHLYDTFCNLCLKAADNGMNEIIVNSPILEKYIRENYPKYKIILSTTKCLVSASDVEKQSEKDYSLVVVDNSFNNSEKLFSLKNKEKYEIIINSYCRDNCPDRVEHYKEIGRAQLEFRSSHFKYCPFINIPFKEQMKKKGFITKEQIYGKYKDAGFRHFKIDGRAFDNRTVADSYLYYLVKPEYYKKVDDIFKQVLDTMDEE